MEILALAPRPPMSTAPPETGLAVAAPCHGACGNCAWRQDRHCPAHRFRRGGNRGLLDAMLPQLGDVHLRCGCLECLTLWPNG